MTNEEFVKQIKDSIDKSGKRYTFKFENTEESLKKYADNAVKECKEKYGCIMSYKINDNKTITFYNHGANTIDIEIYTEKKG